MSYGKQIKKLRYKMLLTQEEFGVFIGASLVTVNRWENEKFEPTIKMKRKLRQLFIDYNIEILD